MALKEIKGRKSNMYRFVTHNWNPIRGKCLYCCSYCYVGNWGSEQKPVFIDRKYLKDDLGAGRFIFICSGCDLFNSDVPKEWIADIYNHTRQYPDNKYLWHTKNPQRLIETIKPGPNDIACVTIESNMDYPVISKAPPVVERFKHLSQFAGQRMITIEPILDFHLDIFVGMIRLVNPIQVNVGADSLGNKLPEPSTEKVLALIESLETANITVHQKDNLKRLLRGGA